MWGMFYSPDEQARRDAAHELSMKLLRSWLSPQQLADFDKYKYFFARGSDTGERYRIDDNFTNFNVIQVDDEDKEVKRFCFVPEGNLPRGDVLLTQKFYIETNELLARARSNRMAPGCNWGYG